MKSASTRFEYDPADAAMSSDCSSEKVWVGLVSIAEPVAKARLRTASSSSVCSRSHASQEMRSHSAAFSCAQGRSGSISATIASRRAVSSAMTRSVSADTGNISPVKRRATPSGPT